MARAGKMVVDQTAVAVGRLVEIADGWQAEMGEAVTKFFQVLLAQHLSFSLVRTPSHAGEFYTFRVLFAMGNVHS